MPKERANSNMPWTNESIEQLKKLAGEGYSYKEIAKELERTTQAIRSICHRENVEVTNKDKPPEWTEPKNRKNKKFTRRPRKWDIQNRVLYGIMLAEDIKVAELAEELDISTRSVQRWIYEGCKPNFENAEQLAQVLNIPSRLLFGEYSYKKSNLNSLNNKKDPS